MTLPLAGAIRIGLSSRLATSRDVRETVPPAEDLGFDSLRCGEHVAYTPPILAPFVRPGYAAALSGHPTPGTCVYVPGAVAPRRSDGEAGRLDRPSPGRPLRMRPSAGRSGLSGHVARRSRYQRVKAAE